MSVIFALDPGKMTGWCVLEVRPDGTPEARVSGQSHDWMPVLFLKDYIKDREQIDFIVYEEFLANPNTLPVLRQRESLIPLEVIGVLKFVYGEMKKELVREQRTVPPLKGFPAAQRKFFTDERLKLLGCYHKGDHARDAIRHALSFAAFQLKELDMKLLVGV